jgi:hypothetical protein
MERFEVQGSRSFEQDHEEREFYSRIDISGHREKRVEDLAAEVAI